MLYEPRKGLLGSYTIALLWLKWHRLVHAHKVSLINVGSIRLKAVRIVWMSANLESH